MHGIIHNQSYRYFLNNVSNVLRIVMLLRFGGLYFDSDVISLKPVPDAELVSTYIPYSQGWPIGKFLK